MMSVVELLDGARRAAHQLSRRPAGEIDELLCSMAGCLDRHVATILRDNERDLARMDSSDPRYDRLMLTPERFASITSDMRSVASLPSPLGVELMTTTRPNGMTIRKVSVAFGVIGVIYEARPNVTMDVVALCLKAGSAVVLKGGSDASQTNESVVTVMREHLVRNGWNPDIVTLLPPSHEATAEMLHAVGHIDLIIPRGSRRLIDFVRENARVPVIETGAGVCHTYIHSSASLDVARAIVDNAKTRRVSVCNALDTLVVDASIASALPFICAPLGAKGVEIYADSEAYALLNGVYGRLRHADSDDFGREWLDYKMSVKVVGDIDEAIEFIGAHTSHHSECIVAQDDDACRRFEREVDAACVYTNVSTAFTDGGQYGFGAEIGISTQKLHARGPMGLMDITTYKYLVSGEGQTR